jgi:alpha-galactosidase
MKTIGCIALALLAAGHLAAQPRDISGTWIGKRTTPMGEMEVVYRLKVDGGKVTGSQSMGMGEAPIVDGSVSGDQFELLVEMGFGENVSRRTVKGKIAGEELHLEAIPMGPPPAGATAPRPGGAGGPGGVAQPGGPGGPGGRMARMPGGPLVLRRGTPAPSYRAGVIDYRSLPKVELPALKALAPNGLAKTPPMGWNSWNRFRTRIDDKTVREISDAMVTTGMRDAGYVYVNIDDGWQWKRDEDGVLQPNPNFPDMKALADYVHSKGLKIGIYSSPGPVTCGGFVGSYGHEEIDARTWAAWGIDYLKYDWCSASRVWKDEDMRAVYQRMGEALARTGRPIFYSLCQYGRNKVQEWGPLVAGNSWRTTFDIRDNWESMSAIGFAQSGLAPYAAPGHWNDPDMLEVGNGGMTESEYRTHFSLWAMVASPLMAGNDVRTMSPEIKQILLNREVIAVNQDKAGKGGYRVSEEGGVEVWVKPLANGEHAVALFNRGANEAKAAVKWADLKIAGKPKVRDLWAMADRGRVEGQFEAAVPAHGVVMIRVTR